MRKTDLSDVERHADGDDDQSTGNRASFQPAARRPTPEVVRTVQDSGDRRHDRELRQNVRHESHLPDGPVVFAVEQVHDTGVEKAGEKWGRESADDEKNDDPPQRVEP